MAKITCFIFVARSDASFIRTTLPFLCKTATTFDKFTIYLRHRVLYLVCLSFYHDDPTRTLVVIVNRTLTSRRPTHQDHIHIVVVKDKIPGVSFGILLVPVYVFLVLRRTRIPLRDSSGHVTNVVIRVRGSNDILLQEIEKR